MRPQVPSIEAQPDGLIEVLLDESAEFGDRHDAAMDLGAFDAAEAEEALARIACDETMDDDLADACGESLAELWVRKASITRAIFSQLSPVAKRIALGTLQARSPSLAQDAENAQDG